MSILRNLFTTEPALVIGLVSAAVVLLTAFGLPINESQRAAITGFVGAILALSGSLLVRSQVTPTASIPAPAAPAPATPTPTDPTPAP